MVQRKFDRIHEQDTSFSMGMESATALDSTIVPLIMNDDAKGDPMSFNAHPEHASWAEIDEPNCYPDSEIRKFSLIVEIVARKSFYGVAGTGDTLVDAKIQYALISCAFPEDLDAIDEKSGLSLKEIIEIQKETTDRQCFPLFNNVNLTNPSILPAAVPGLTTTQAIEGVAWLPNIVKDQQRYGKVKGLLRKVLPIGVRTIHMNMKKSVRKRIKITFVPSNAKFINPYTFLGIMLRVPKTTTVILIDQDVNQIMSNSDTSTSAHFLFSIKCKYNERNPEFHMAKV